MKIKKARQTGNLNVDPEAHSLAEAIARETGETLTRAVTEALRERYERLQRRGEKASLEELRRSPSAPQPTSNVPTLIMLNCSTTNIAFQNDFGHLGADRILISTGTFLELAIVLERQTGPEVARQWSGRTLRGRRSMISEKAVIRRG
jgi:hypothetical protein